MPIADETDYLKVMGSSSTRSIVVHSIVGALFGLLFLHPLTMIIYVLGLDPNHDTFQRIVSSVFHQTFVSFEPAMIEMASIFVTLGLVIGAGSGWYYTAVRRQARLLAIRDQELAISIESLVLGGESHRIEFKTSIRWDIRSKSINKALEHSVVKTIAGFMNGGGGVLLLGVSDGGVTVGLDADYETLKKPGRDGYQQHIMHLIADRLGTSFCDLVTVRFHPVEENDVCVVSVSKSKRPVYVTAGEQVKYFLRTGNSTRELNTREAIEHVQVRFPEINNAFNTT